MDDTALKDLNTFFSQYPIKQYAKGQILIYAYEDPSGIFYLESGKVRKYDVSDEGSEVILNVFTPKVFFPIAWAINKTPNKYFFEAQTEIEVRRAPVDAFIAYLESRPNVIYELLKQVHNGLEDTQRRVVYLMGGNTHSRLLFELLIEAKRSGEMRSDGSCLITIGIADLARRAGLSRETISRELGRVIQSGVLTREGHSLLIHDMHDLEKQLGER
jgi:CRP/FNR family transcriptional regulator